MVKRIGARMREWKGRMEKKGLWRPGSVMVTGLSLAGMILAPRIAKAEGIHGVFLSPRERVVHENPALLASHEEQLKAGLEIGPKHGGLNGIFVLRQGEKYRPAIWFGNRFWLLTERKGDYVAHPVENVFSLGAAKEFMEKLRAGIQIDLSAGRGFGAAVKGGLFWTPKGWVSLSGLLGTQESEIGIHTQPLSQTTLSAIVGNETVAGEIRQTIKNVTAHFRGGYAWKGGMKWEAGAAFGPWEVHIGWGPAPKEMPKEAGYAGVRYRFLPKKTIPRTGK